MAIRFIDVRRGELRPLIRAFAMLFFIVAAYAILETARDALVLTKLPLRALGIVYTAMAVCVLPAATLASRSANRFGAQRSLGGALLSSGAVLVILFAVPTTLPSVVALYVASGTIGAVVMPMLWNHVGSIFTVAQGRRLLGPLAVGGVLGATLGSTAAAALLAVLRVKALITVSAGLLVVAVLVLVLFPEAQQSAPQSERRAEGALRSAGALRGEPFLLRIALLAVVSTACLLTLDYLFKWTVAQTVPREHVARFVARYYAFLNGAALVVQLFVSGALVRRIGVAGTIAVTPILLLSGAIGSLATGGALISVLIVKGLDGTLRHSVHRLATELIYLPVRERARARAKPLIDGFIVRATQAATGALLFALARTNYSSSRVLAAGVVGLAILWLVVGLATRSPYLGLLRRAIAIDGVASQRPDPIDSESVETLVQLLAHEDPLIVVGAMNALERRGRERLIPALVLLHQDEGVLLHALHAFAVSDREDWVGRGRLLLLDQRATIRMAAGRALAMHGRLGAEDLARDASERVSAYAAIHLSLESGTGDLLDDRDLAVLALGGGDGGDERRLGLLAAIADAAPNRRLSRLLAALAARPGRTSEWTEALARAASSQRAVFLIPSLIARLSFQEGREIVRTALVLFDRDALDAIRSALQDPALERGVRIQLPTTLARFGSKQAADLLLEIIEGEGDGLVRYKAIRGLGRLVAERNVGVDRVRIERLAYANLLEHLRLLGLRAVFESALATPPASSLRRQPTKRLLVRLLDDKLRQALERTFRLLKVAYPNEDFHRVHIACLSDDKRARANAAEFLDAFFHRRGQHPLRTLLRAVTEDLPIAERVLRTVSLTTRVTPATESDALAMLVDDADMTVAALAKLHAANIAGESLSVVIDSRSGTPIELSTRRALEDEALQNRRPHV